MKTGKEEFILVVREDDQTGEWGWCLNELTVQDQPMVANGPYLIAHDLFEHVNGSEEIGGIAEELQAMGGFWLTRGKWDDVRREGFSQSGFDVWVRTISNLWVRFGQSEGLGGIVPSYVETEYDEEIREAIDEARKQTVNELRYSDILLPNDDFANWALCLISDAIVKHQEMYGTAGMANTLFYEFVNAFEGKDRFGNPTLPHAEEHSQEIIKITVDFDDLQVTMDHQEFDYAQFEEEEELV